MDEIAFATRLRYLFLGHVFLWYKQLCQNDSLAIWRSGCWCFDQEQSGHYTVEVQNAAARWPVVVWFLVYRFAGHFQKVDGGRGKVATVEPMVQAQLTSSNLAVKRREKNTVECWNSRIHACKPLFESNAKLCQAMLWMVTAPCHSLCSDSNKICSKCKRQRDSQGIGNVSWRSLDGNC